MSVSQQGSATADVFCIPYSSYLVWRGFRTIDDTITTLYRVTFALTMNKRLDPPGWDGSSGWMVQQRLHDKRQTTWWLGL